LATPHVPAGAGKPSRSATPSTSQYWVALGRAEAVKKLPRTPKQRNTLVDNQAFAKTVFAKFQFFHSFAATILAPNAAQGRRNPFRVPNVTQVCGFWRMRQRLDGGEISAPDHREPPGIKLRLET